MLKELSDRPNVAKLECFLKELLEQQGEKIEFVALFGSMARGDWLVESDYDVLVGLYDDDGKRFIDRLGEFSPRGNIEVFPYSRSEWQRMFAEFHSLLLEALAYGIVLWDRGSFAKMQKTFQKWLRSGKVIRWGCGWKIKKSGGDE